MTSTQQERPASITQQLINYLKDNPKRSNREIAEAIGAKANSIASMTCQLEVMGKLRRVETGQTKATGRPSVLYEIGDLESTTPYAPRTKRGPRTPLATAISAEMEADAQAREAVERARNGHKATTVADELDDALNGSEAQESDPDGLFGDSQRPELFSRPEEPSDTAFPTPRQVALAELELEKQRVEKEIVREQLRAELMVELRPQLRREIIAEIQAAAPQAMTTAEPAPQQQPAPPPPAPKKDGAEVELPEEVEARAQFSTLIPIHRMMDTIAKTMAREVMTRLHMELTSEVANMSTRLKSQVEMAAPSPEQLAARVANAAQPIKKRLTTVLIIGLLPGQAGMIVQEFGDCFDLRFWKDEAPEMLKVNAKNAEYTITFTSKISHSAEEVLKSLNLPIIRCSGGMSMLRHKLTELYTKASDEKQEG